MNAVDASLRSHTIRLVADGRGLGPPKIKKTSAPSARLLWLLVRSTYMYESTPQQQETQYVPRRTAGITGTGNLGEFGTTSIPVPDTSVTSVYQYRYGTLR